MKKLLKSFLIATASIGTVGGSTAAVVSCGSDEAPPKKDNSTPWSTLFPATLNTHQIDYDAAVASLKTKIASLSNFQIVHGGASDPQTMIIFKTSIEMAIRNLISADTKLNAIIAGISVNIPAGQITTDNIGNDNPANGLILTVGCQYEDVNLETPFTFSIKYDVVNSDQDNYNASVNTIIQKLTNLTASETSFISGESKEQVKQQILDLINSAIGINNQYIATFSSVGNLDLEAVATAIEGVITSGAKTDQAQSISNITFNSKRSVTTKQPQSFTLKYVVLGTKQEQYTSQLSSLIGKFTATGTGKISIAIINSSTQSEVENLLNSTISTEITTGGSAYSLLDKTNISFKGISNSTFQNNAPGDYSTPSNSATTAVTITIGSTDKTGTITPSSDQGFNFYYTINPSTLDRTSYTNALADIVSHFGAKTGTTPNNPVSFQYNDASGDGWKASVIGTLRTAIYTYANSAYSTLFDFGTTNNNIDISITGSNFINTLASTPTFTTAVITFTIPSKWSATGAAGIPIASKIALPVGFIVTATQDSVDSAAGKIVSHFNNVANAISIPRGGITTQGGTAQGIDKIISDAINTYINSSGSDALTSGEKSSIAVTTSGDVTDFSSVSYDSISTQVQQGTAIHLTIHKSAQAGAAINDYSTQTFAIYYNVVGNANDAEAQGILQRLVNEVITDSTRAQNPVILNIEKGAGSTDIEKSIKALILPKLSSTPGVSAWFQTGEANIHVTGVVTTGTSKTIDTSTPNTGTLSAEIKVSVDIATSKSSTVLAIPVSLAGLSYKVAVSNQALWDQQASAIILAAQSLWQATPLALSKQDDVAAIKLKIATAVNTIITSTPVENKTNIASAISANDVILALTNFDFSTDTATGTHRTSTANPKEIEISIPKAATATNVSPVGKSISIDYTVTSTNQDTYEAALVSIADHFSVVGTDIFSATATADEATIKGLIQTSVFNYLSSLPSNQRISLIPATAADITVTIHGTLLTAVGEHTTDLNNYISLSIPAASGATTQDIRLGTPSKGIKYLITTTNKDTYNDQNPIIQNKD